MVQALDAVAVRPARRCPATIAANSKLAAQSFLHQRRDFGVGPRACGVDPEGRPPRSVPPTPHSDCTARTRESQKIMAQDVAPVRRQRAVIGQHGGGSPVPRDHVPGGRTDDRGAVGQRVEQALQARRDRIARPVARLGRAPEPDQEHMLALDLRQRERARDPVEHVRGRTSAAALLQPGVPGRADIGPLRHLLAPQAGCAPSRGRVAERRRVELRAPVPEIGAERATVGRDWAPC